MPVPGVQLPKASAINPTAVHFAPRFIMLMVGRCELQSSLDRPSERPATDRRALGSFRSGIQSNWTDSTTAVHQPETA